MYVYVCVCVSWFEFDLVVSICQVIRYKDFSEDAYPRCGDYLQFEESVCVYFCAYFLFLCYYAFIFPPGPTQYIFHTSMARYSPLVLKVLLNTNQAYPLAVQTQV